MYPHRLRLHGPWDYAAQAATVVSPDGCIKERPAPLPAPGRIRIPTTWRATALDGFRGRVRLRRTFHWPRKLEPHEHVWLTFRGADYFAGAAVNSTELGRHEGYFDPFEFEVTELLQPRNELVVQLDCPAEEDPEYKRLIRGSLETATPSFAGGMWDEVALQVRSLAFLRDVTVRAELQGSSGTIRATGQVVGEPGAVLGLDLTVDGTWMAEHRVEARPQGSPFQLEARIDPVQLWWPHPLGEPRCYAAKLELHGNARTLDQAERRVGFRRVVIDPEARRAEISGRPLELVLEELLPRENPLNAAEELLEGSGHANTPSGDSVRMARVTGRIVAPGLYDAADRAGALLWQDFPLSGGGSLRESFRSEVTRQADAMIRQLGHHPAIVLWCCHHGPTEHDREIDRILRETIVQLDPSRQCLRGAVDPLTR